MTPPQEPGPEDCCQSGCQECVWEIYYRERRAYEKALAERESGAEKEKEEREGGSGDGNGGDGSDGSSDTKNVPSSSSPLDAFAALEERLAKQEAERKKKQQQEAESATGGAL